MSAREELAATLWETYGRPNTMQASPWADLDSGVQTVWLRHADVVLAHPSIVAALVEAGTIEPVTEQVGWTEWPIEGVFRLRPRSQG